MTITPDVRRQYFDPAAEQQERVIRLEPSAVRPLGPTRRAGTPWTDDEHERFLQGLEMFPRGPWKRIAEHVATRTTRQTMTHAQKYRQKIARFREGRDLQSIAQRRQHRDERLRRRNRSAREAREYKQDVAGEDEAQRRRQEEEEEEEEDADDDNDDERLLYELPLPETPRATTQASGRPKPRQSPRMEREVPRPPTTTTTTMAMNHGLPRRMHTPTQRSLNHHYSSSSISMEPPFHLGHNSPYHYHHHHHHHHHHQIPISGGGGGTFIDSSSSRSSGGGGGGGSGSIGVVSRPQAAELAAVEWLLQELKPVHLSRLDTELEMTLHSVPDPRSGTPPRFVFPPGPPTT